MSAQQVAHALMHGLSKDSSEVLVGWQAHVAVWCDRLSPKLLELALKLTAPGQLMATHLMPARQRPSRPESERWSESFS
ncbi:MAG: hypothetical protein AAGC93_11805 [Cyanobacteria bacterium P01_F01_bin.53]